MAAEQWSRPPWELWSAIPNQVTFEERLRWRYRWSAWMEQRVKKQLSDAGIDSD